MYEIAFNSEVVCGDLVCGRLKLLLMDPQRLTVASLIVTEADASALERLVPLDRVLSAVPGRIHLDGTQTGLGEFPSFLETEFTGTLNPAPYPQGKEYRAEDYTDPEGARVLPKGPLPGRIILNENTLVEASDGELGKVDLLQVDAENGKITDLVMASGGLWDRKRILVPAATIDRIEKNTFFLRIDRRQLQGLPVFSTHE